jgi:hypothetical protein
MHNELAELACSQLPERGGRTLGGGTLGPRAAAATTAAAARTAASAASAASAAAAAAAAAVMLLPRLPLLNSD